MLAKCRRVGTRHAHTRRELPYPIEGGLGKFLPPRALQTLAEYQDGLLARLDQELLSASDLILIPAFDVQVYAQIFVVADRTAERHSSVAQIAVNYAKHRERTLAFNYAVLAWNNSFFLDNLVCPFFFC